MAKRLNKITREFNVGISTIVEFLEQKGHSIDSNPNTKVPDELYALLENEFSSDIKMKKESDNVNLAEARKKKVTISLNDIEEEDENTDALEEKEEVFDEPAPNVTIKVVGKIDLDKKANETEEEESEDEPAVEEQPVVEAKEESDAEEKVIEEEKEPVVEEPIAVAEENTPPKEKDESSDEKTQKTENNVKVVGKIDLDSINQKTRPDRKSKEEKEKERQARKKKRVESRSDNSESSNTSKPRFQKNKKEEPETYKSKRDKLTGPTVVGKIDLPDKSNDHDEDGKKKKKRKRIKKEKINLPNDNNDNKLAKKNKNNNNKKKRPNKREEISDEDIQKQVKDTLSRLTNKGGKSKASKHRRDKREAIRLEREEELEQQSLEEKILKVTEFVSVNDLAQMMSVPVNQIIASCMSLGLLVSINQRIDAETISLIAEEFGYEVEFISVEVHEAIEDEEETDENLEPRSPIITVMGHVDHGKTSLLDYIRNANVIAGEAGGITQHIGAYSVKLDSGKRITFLDTPGHEAFTAMRARGAQVTDLAIIVVAADDNVMPQTVEAINHAAAAGVPIVFAINKIDKDGANPDRIKEELANMNYLVEDWGGKYQSQEISAKFGKNLDLLLEKVLLEAELLDLKSNPNKKAQGTVIESELDKGRGYVSTLLVESGTLRVGDILLAGRYTGKVKAMFNERNTPVKEAGPATPVIILGLDGAPQAGDKFNVMSSDREAREIANKREQLQREQELKTQKHITLDEIGRRIAIGNFQELNVIIKGDVDGSVEALSDSLIKLSTDEIQVNVKHKAVGQISESDILLASASDAIIVGFQVRPSVSARKLAEKEGIDIRLYSIIYDAINELKDAMAGMLSPEIREEVVATAEILETFRISKVGTIAGCIVQDGKIKRSSQVRIIRDGIVVYTGELASLKRHKDDAKEVSRGFECGLNIANFNDIKPGDIIEAYEIKEIQRTL